MTFLPIFILYLEFRGGLQPSSHPQIRLCFTTMCPPYNSYKQINTSTIIYLFTIYAQNYKDEHFLYQALLEYSGGLTNFFEPLKINCVIRVSRKLAVFLNNTSINYCL